MSKKQSVKLWINGTGEWEGVAHSTPDRGVGIALASAIVDWANDQHLPDERLKEVLKGLSETIGGERKRKKTTPV